jgi:hypothetical protein
MAHRVKHRAANPARIHFNDDEAGAPDEIFCKKSGADMNAA